VHILQYMITMRGDMKLIISMNLPHTDESCDMRKRRVWEHG